MVYSFEFKIFIEVSDIVIVSLCVLGILGNTVMIIICSRPCLRKLSVSTYFCAEAAAALLLNLIFLNNYLGGKVGFIIANQSNLACQLATLFQKILSSTCIWFQVLASIDQFMMIVFSKRFKLIHTIPFKLAVILTIIVLNVCVASHVFADNRIRSYWILLLKKRQLMCANFINFQNVILE